MKKEKVHEKGLRDSQNSIVKKEKVREKGLRDSQNSIVKKEKVREKRLRDSQNSIEKKEKVREKGFLIAKIPSIKGFPPKRPETTTSCVPENPIHQGIPTKEA
jgi:uncharacterized protein with gpF-like domain